MKCIIISSYFSFYLSNLQEITFFFFLFFFFYTWALPNYKYYNYYAVSSSIYDYSSYYHYYESLFELPALFFFLDFPVGTEADDIIYMIYFFDKPCSAIMALNYGSFIS